MAHLKHPSTVCQEHEGCREYGRLYDENLRRKAGAKPKVRRSPVPVDGAEHGTRKGYRGAGCGCPTCVGWSRGQRNPAAAKGRVSSCCAVCGVPVLEHSLLRRCG